MTDNKNPVFKVKPTVSMNPNLSVPLAAVLRYTADRKVSTIVTVSDGDRNWEINFNGSYDPQSGLPIIGMRANKRHTFFIAIQDESGHKTMWSETLEYMTPKLPSGPRDWPPISINVSHPELMEPGITLISIRRRVPGREIMMTKAQRAFSRDWSLIVGLDLNGDVVWYYQVNTRIAGFDYLHNGHLFYLTHDFCAVEIDMLGNKVAQWYAGKRPQGEVEGATPVDVQTIHHQPHELPSGNFLVMTAHSKKIKNFYTSEVDPGAEKADTNVMCDEIVEFRRDGSIVWNWNSFEYLDPNRIGYQTLGPYWKVRGFPDHADWTHGNGLFYDEKNDAVLICLRMQDAIIKVDRSTGEIVWILGDHHGWPDWLQSKLLRPEGKVHWPYHMHNPKATPEGTILLWNNSIFQALPFDGKRKMLPHETYSRAVEYLVDEKRMTVREVWASENGPDNDSCSCFAMGDVHWMPKTDNVLVFYGSCMARRDDMSYDPTDMRSQMEFPQWTRVREFLHTTPPKIVFEAHIEDHDDVIMWATFGGMKISSLYPSV